MKKETTNCFHCGRTITATSTGWADMQATGDDKIWKYTCDENDTFPSDHEDDAQDKAWVLYGDDDCPQENFVCTAEEMDPYILDGKIDPDQEPQPIGMQCPIIWDNEEGRQDVYISFMSAKNQEHAELTGLDEYGVSDDLIFYHMDPEEVKNLWLAIAGSREQFSVGAGWAIDLSEHWAMAYEL